MKSLEAVLFDMDGTLIDSVEVFYRILNETCTRIGLPQIRKKIIIDSMRRGKSPWGDFLHNVSFTNDMLPKAQKISSEIYTSFYKKYAKIYPGSLPFLREIKKQSIRMGIVTSTYFPDNVPEEIIKLRKTMDVVVTKLDTKRIKPYPDPIFLACNKLHIKPEKAIYVGDTPLDIRAGKAAGMQTIGVLWGVGTRESLIAEGANEVVANFDKLRLAILSRIQSFFIRESIHPYAQKSPHY
ncbi:MAG: HAD family hydrolase [Deltaproteobacteria bacterium]|nr:HAD family hydrolase [Deltaproteobacteria bacterium]